MTLLGITALINFISCVVLAVFVIAKNHKSNQARTYFWLNFTVALYSFGYFFWQASISDAGALIWFKVLFTGIALINVAYLHFVIISFDIFSEKINVLILCYILNAVFIVLNWMGYVYNGLSERFGLGFWPNPTWIFHLYLLFWLLQCLYGFTLLLNGVLVLKGKKQQQISLFMIAAAVGFIGGATNWFVWYSINIPPYLNILVSIYVLLTAYAITKTRLMDISVVISRSFSYGLAAIFYIAVYSIIFALLNYFGINSAIQMGIGIIMIVLSGLTFQYLRLAVQTPADKAFIKGWYDYRIVQRLFSERFRQVTDKEDIHTIVSEIFDKELEINKIELVYNNEIQLKIGQPLFERLCEQKDILHLSREDSPFAKIAAPCFIGDKMEAVILIGPKRTEEGFNDVDIDLFRTLSDEIGIIIQRLKPLEKAKADLIVEHEKAKSAEEIAGKAMEVAEKMSQQASYATLTRGIAHEIRNPMAIMLSRAEITEKHLDDKEAVAKFADMIKRNIIRLINITETMLRYGGAVSKEKVKFPIEPLLNDIVLLAEGECKKREINLTVESSSEHIIFGDPNRLNQAFLNMILNAMQAIGNKGTVVIAVKESAFTNKKGEAANGIEVKIKDSGCGIPPENLPNIFDPFFTTKHENTGLGLSLVARIIDEHDGTIEINSEVGKGTAFRVYLPV